MGSSAAASGSEGVSAPAGEDDAHRHGRPLDETRDAAILEAAMAMVAEVGYERASIDGVAARAHASKATIYRRWPGKAQLVAAAVRQWAGEPVAQLPDTGSLKGDLLALCRLIRSRLEGKDGDVVFGLAFAARTDPQLGRALHEQLFETRGSLSGEVVRRAVARGELPSAGAAGKGAALIDEVAPALALMRQLSGCRIDDAYVRHLTEDVLAPLLEATVKETK